MVGEDVLVTGGTGFIGSHVVEELVDRGYSVTVLTHSHSRGNLWNVIDQVKLIVADISRTAWLSEVPRARTVIHLACNQRSFSFRRPQRDVSVNLMGSVNVLEYARKHDARIIFSSNSGIYGACVQAKEDDPVNCSTPYDVDKYSAELMMRAYKDQYGIKSTVLRFATIYGPRQRINEKKGWMPVVATFAANLLLGRPITIFGDGLQTRDLVFVKDVPDALLRAMHYSAEFDIFNLSSGREMKIVEIFELVSRFVGVKVRPAHAPSSPGDIRRMSYSNEKIRRELGWKPRTSPEEGIRLTVDAIRQELGQEHR